jgi:hypothetical protein
MGSMTGPTPGIMPEDRYFSMPSEELGGDVRRKRRPWVRSLTQLPDAEPELVNSGRAASDRIGALRIAARFFDRSADTKIFKKGMDAYNKPRLLPAAWEGPGTAKGSGVGSVSEEI